MITVGAVVKESVFVGPALIMCVMRSGTVPGVTLSTIVKAGRSRTVVESGTSGLSGTGIFEADSINLFAGSVSIDSQYATKMLRTHTLVM